MLKLLEFNALDDTKNFFVYKECECILRNQPGPLNYSDKLMLSDAINKLISHLHHIGPFFNHSKNVRLAPGHV